MAALASLATLVGAGATIYGNVRQAQQQNTLNKAQVNIAQQQDTARQQALLAQQQQDAQQRQSMLAKTIATTRARLAASGVAPDAGSAAALTAVVVWSPWSGEGDEPSTRPTPTSGQASPSPTEVTPTVTTATPMPTSTPSATQGSVGVGTVVVSVGQPCQFNDVGVREETVAGEPVVCQRRPDGTYAWDTPPGQKP